MSVLGVACAVCFPPCAELRESVCFSLSSAHHIIVPHNPPSPWSLCTPALLYPMLSLLAAVQGICSAEDLYVLLAGLPHSETHSLLSLFFFLNDIWCPALDCQYSSPLLDSGIHRDGKGSTVSSSAIAGFLSYSEMAGWWHC